MTELKPCWFCGGEARLMAQHFTDGSHIYWVRCRRCGMDGPHMHDGEPAIVAWNTLAEGGAIAEMAQRIQSLETECAKLQEELRKAGTCELAYGENDDGVDGWYTHCGGWFAATRKDRRLVHPGFCQMCGGKAVKR